MLNKIFIAFPEVNLDWLMTGHGEMLSNAVEVPPDNPGTFYTETHNGAKFYELPGGGYRMEVSLVPFAAYGRFANECDTLEPDNEERFVDMAELNRSINIGLKEVGKELGIEKLQFYAARHSLATIAANEAGIDRWTVNLMLNHTDQSMRVTELYIKRDFSPVNEANYKLMEYVFGEMEGAE